MPACPAWTRRNHGRTGIPRSRSAFIRSRRQLPSTDTSLPPSLPPRQDSDEAGEAVRNLMELGTGNCTTFTENHTLCLCTPCPFPKLLAGHLTATDNPWMRSHRAWIAGYGSPILDFSSQGLQDMAPQSRISAHRDCRMPLPSPGFQGWRDRCPRTCPPRRAQSCHRFVSQAGSFPGFFPGSLDH